MAKSMNKSEELDTEIRKATPSRKSFAAKLKVKIIDGSKKCASCWRLCV